MVGRWSVVRQLSVVCCGWWVVGCRLLVAEWRSAIGDRPLAVGGLASRVWVLAFKVALHWMFGVGCWMLDVLIQFCRLGSRIRGSFTVKYQRARIVPGFGIPGLRERDPSRPRPIQLTRIDRL